MSKVDANSIHELVPFSDSTLLDLVTLEPAAELLAAVESVGFTPVDVADPIVMDGSVLEP